MKIKQNQVAFLATTLMTFGALAGGVNGATVVTNISEINDQFATVDNGWRGLSFTTDSNTYSLNSVNLLLGPGTSGNNDFGVSIWSDLSNSPSSSIANLAGTPNPDSTPPQEFVYTATSAITLAANTTYWIVATSNASSSYRWEATTSNNQTGIWSFGDDFATSTNSGATWSSSGTLTMQASVDATVVPEPSSALLIGLGVFGAMARRKRIA